MKHTLCLLTLAAAMLVSPAFAQEPKTLDDVCIFATSGADRMDRRADAAKDLDLSLIRQLRFTEARALSDLVSDYRQSIKKLRHDGCLSPTLAEAKADVERDSEECHKADAAVNAYIDHMRAEGMRKGLK